MTTYVVLQMAVKNTETAGENPSPFWQIVGPNVESVSAEDAIRKAVSDQGGTYVAVPLRSWQPVNVTVETKRTVNVG